MPKVSSEELVGRIDIPLSGSQSSHLGKNHANLLESPLEGTTFGDCKHFVGSSLNKLDNVNLPNESGERFSNTLGLVKPFLGKIADTLDGLLNTSLCLSVDSPYRSGGLSSSSSNIPAGSSDKPFDSPKNLGFHGSLKIDVLLHEGEHIVDITVMLGNLLLKLVNLHGVLRGLYQDFIQL